MQLRTESGWYDVKGLRTYRAVGQAQSPTDPLLPSGGVLMLPMITGIGQQLRDWADSVAATVQTTVLVWDPWHGPSADDSSLDKLRELLNNLEDHRAIEEINTLLAHMKSELELDQITIIGWCLGGRYALLAGALNPQLSGVVAMHPTIAGNEFERGEYDAIAAAGKISAPVVVHYPGLDHIVSRETFDRLQLVLQSRSDATSILGLHPKAHHGFSDRKNHGNPDNAAAFALSWPQTLAFIDQTVNRPTPNVDLRKGDIHV